MISARLAGAYVETLFSLKKYSSNLATVQKADKILSLLPPQIGPYPQHPFFSERATQFTQEILTYKGPTSNLSINFGDSLVDMWRDRFTSINIPMSVGGMHHYQMLQMAQVIKPILDARKLVPKYIMIGTLGGNPLLQHQEINSVIQKSIDCLNGLRILWPNPQIKMIVYGLPPVIALYATIHSLEFEAAIYKWVVSDPNSVFIPMFKSFAGKWGIYPKTWCTADGVHLSPVGQVMLDERFERAKTELPRTLLDYTE